MNVNLEKELTSKREVRKENPINEVQLLLADRGQKDVEMLGHLAPSSILVAAQAEVGKKIELENLDKAYGKIFHINEIKDLAVEYRLRFLNSQYFKGKMDVDAIAKVNEFSKETNTSVDEWTLKTRFFVLAPPSCFQLNDVKQVRKDPDPVLFYKVDEQHYRMVHKWGHDFSIFRKILGWKWKNASNKRHYYLLFTLPIMVLLLSLVASPLAFITHPIISALIVLPLAYIIASFCNAGTLKTDGTPGNSRHHEDYFTPGNWNSTNKLK